jgi:hypothetical protein
MKGEALWCRKRRRYWKNGRETQTARPRLGTDEARLPELRCARLFAYKLLGEHFAARTAIHDPDSNMCER